MSCPFKVKGIRHNEAYWKEYNRRWDIMEKNTKYPKERLNEYDEKYYEGYFGCALIDGDFYFSETPNECVGEDKCPIVNRR